LTENWKPSQTDLPSLLRRALPAVEKPARYIGGEFNAVQKDWNSVSCRIALAFPDVYEIGMSFLGFRILYHVINQDPRFLAERAYSPWTDMEAQQRQYGIPAHTLESFRPLSDFDCVGFTLQTEMAYTNILTLLELGGIPLKAVDRNDRSPIVLAGGPCAFNPEPLADFLDAVLIGDGEEALPEIMGILSKFPKETTSRLQRLEAISRVKGVYVPSFYDVTYQEDGTIEKVTPNRADVPARIERRLLSDLDKAPMPAKPILPTMDIVHDRIQLEVFRGCARGCRFCQAGMTYRPVRERNPETILEGAEEMVRRSGYEEMSLISLSTADYTPLEGLVTRLADEFTSHNVSISAGSMRVDSKFDKLFGIMGKVKKSGFTFAPEAGTDRLRRVINKNITEEDILNTMQKVFTHGWDLVKLYFMFALPLETNEDLQGIVDLYSKVQSIGRKIGGHRKQVNVSVGCFVPKPFTPFQWAAQDSRETIAAKNEFLCKKLRLTRHERNERLSKLEAFLALGDRRAWKAILRAWEKGARFDGWSDRFKPECWNEAFAETKVDPLFYSDRAKTFGETLPWDHLFAEMDKKFLWGEWEAAQRAEQSGDCRWEGCLSCGVCSPEKKIAHQLREVVLPPSPPIRKLPDYQDQKMRFRVRFSKTGRARYLSHLTVVRVFQRALHRMEAPLSYTGGFSKRPRTVFTPPVSLGVESLCEAADFILYQIVDLNTLERTLKKEMPLGFQILKVEAIPFDALDAMNAFEVVEYEVVPDGVDLVATVAASLNSDLALFLKKESAVITFETEKGRRTKDVKQFVLGAQVNGTGPELKIRLELDLKSPQSVKLERLLPCVFPSFEWARKGWSATRMDMRAKQSV
jgi:radical SAM family uncharacterized protein/radical SAM-linked protein